jgi:Ca2+-transporting ATPase
VTTVHWHLREAAEVARAHGVDPALGLDLDEVRTRARHHGPNELPTAPPRSLAALVAEQFRDLMILVLVGAPSSPACWATGSTPW